MSNSGVATSHIEMLGKCDQARSLRKEIDKKVDQYTKRLDKEQDSTGRKKLDDQREMGKILANMIDTQTTLYEQVMTQKRARGDSAESQLRMMTSANENLSDLIDYGKKYLQHPWTIVTRLKKFWGDHPKAAKAAAVAGGVGGGFLGAFLLHLSVLECPCAAGVAAKAAVAGAGTLKSMCIALAAAKGAVLALSVALGSVVGVLVVFGLYKLFVDGRGDIPEQESVNEFMHRLGNSNSINHEDLKALRRRMQDMFGTAFVFADDDGQCVVCMETVVGCTHGRNDTHDDLCSVSPYQCVVPTAQHLLCHKCARDPRLPIECPLCRAPRRR